MAVSKKVLKLNYTENKNGKTKNKSYHFNIKNELESHIARQVGEQLANLVKESVTSYELTTTEEI